MTAKNTVWDRVAARHENEQEGGTEMTARTADAIVLDIIGEMLADLSAAGVDLPRLIVASEARAEHTVIRTPDNALNRFVLALGFRSKR